MFAVKVICVYNLGKFYCNICDLYFNYKSKYTRHLQCSKHIQLESIINNGVDDISISYTTSFEETTDLYPTDEFQTVDNDSYEVRTCIIVLMYIVHIYFLLI